ncbi:unnamed protein product [Didymodactylos carnosus]|uniref:Uncharacterized protein n=1 Tax=Didymodactylos carnosus TaxID=1234261 RepID=A0A814LQR1_9BILA|nr:unnamed protein product [Didymodactylos carnosus]CAF1069019.1 unnamed protein product [Didymodactylos carnosus]CAF3595729.1 unnamed protein product [Didymodactylos carnosus]CAF3836358.1 unnamed protein product [Didymodactylos carnosus]
MYRNVTKVLNTRAVSQYVIFDEGHRENKMINEQSLQQAKIKIEELFLVTAKRTSDAPSLPVIVIEKETCVAAWEWYSFLFGNALALFRTQTQSVVEKLKSTTLSHVQKILNIEFNIFMRSALTAKVPGTGRTAPFHNSPHLLDPALQKLLSDGTIIQGYFLLDSKQHKHLSYMKLPVPIDKQKRDIFERNFITYEISLDAYEENYFHEKKPSNQVLSQEAIGMFRRRAELVPHYHKHQELNEIIDDYLQCGEIIPVFKEDKGGKVITCYEISQTATAFEPQTIPITAAVSITNQAVANNHQTVKENMVSKESNPKPTTVSTGASISLPLSTTNVNLQNSSFQELLASFTPQQLQMLTKATSTDSHQYPHKSDSYEFVNQDLLENEFQNQLQDFHDDVTSQRAVILIGKSVIGPKAKNDQTSDDSSDDEHMKVSDNEHPPSPSIQPNDQITTNEQVENLTADTTAKHLLVDPKLKKIAKKIMLHKSVVFAQADMTRITTHGVERDKAKDMLLATGLKWSEYVESYTKYHPNCVSSGNSTWKITEEVAALLDNDYYYAQYVRYNRVTCYTKDKYFKRYYEYLYSLFTSFWTRHQTISKACDPEKCSRVFITDGHRKANRFVCAQQDVFDFQIPEMGGVVTGCSETPRRNTGNKTFCDFHQPTNNTTPTQHTSDNLLRADTGKLKIAKDAVNQEYEAAEDQDICNVFREDIIDEKKRSSYGFLATFLNCMVIVGFDECPRSEGLQVIPPDIQTRVHELVDQTSLSSKQSSNTSSATQLSTVIDSPSQQLLSSITRINTNDSATKADISTKLLTNPTSGTIATATASTLRLIAPQISSQVQKASTAKERFNRQPSRRLNSSFVLMLFEIFLAIPHYSE